ncbi:MAG TPA: LuxR C-terminal-related transcriptional regulator, partial [Thermomicrobiales bacterium]|nr:LuxR C-terminal-related transcriptional regulator [Thermomicrobiales bacterium]
VAWSYDLLPPAEQSAFRELSVFTGGFTIETAAAVLDAESSSPGEVPVGVLDLVASLLDKSLLRKREGSGRTEPRLSMLVTVGEYGHEQLRAMGEYESAHDRHARWALAFAETSARHLAGPDASRWLHELDDEQGNIRLAFRWLDASGDRSRFVRLALALEDYWLTRARYSEALQWLGRAMELSADERDVPDARLRCTLAAAWIALRGGDGMRATVLADAGLALARENSDVRLVVRSLNVAAGVARRADDHQRAFDLIEESRRRSEAAGDRRAVADALRESAYALMNLGRMEEAIEACRASIAYFEEVGNTQSAAMALDNMSLVYYLRGDYAEAHRCSREAIEVFRRLGYPRGVGIALCHLGLSATHLGDVEAAWNFHLEELAHRASVGDPRGYAVWLEAVALLLAVCGDGTGALTILGAADAARERAQAPLARTERGDRDHSLRLVRRQLTDDAIDAALRQGQSLAIPAAIERACALVPVAIAGYRKPEPPSARSAFGLSAREEEILQLVAQRLSDREIAEALFISRHTVARHVANILRKLDVSSRYDAARIANEH